VTFGGRGHIRGGAIVSLLQGYDYFVELPPLTANPRLSFWRLLKLMTRNFCPAGGGANLSYSTWCLGGISGLKIEEKSYK
jgi:hypothetical protein